MVTLTPRISEFRSRTLLGSRGCALLCALAMASLALSAEPPAVPEAAAKEAAKDPPPIVGLLETAITDCSSHHKGYPEAAASGPSAGFVSGSPVRTLKVADMPFPMAEVQEGHQAILMMSYLVDPLGNPRFAHVEREIANDIKENRFDAVAIDTIRRSTFAPATVDGKAVTSWRRTKIRFIIPQMGRMGNILSDEKLTEFVKKARIGDLKSQMIISFADSIAHEEVAIPESEQRHFLAAAAAGGERSALLRVAQLVGGPGCKAPAEVEAFLHQHAMSGKSDLEMLQAARLLTRGDPGDVREISVMLHGAANSSEAFVQLWSAGLLATAPIAGVRDPAAALATVLELKLSGDPDAGEALAAALAANGQFAEAIRVQTDAIKAAQKLHWKDDYLQARLAKYQAGEPWIAYLCDCTSLVPAGGS